MIYILYINIYIIYLYIQYVYFMVMVNILHVYDLILLITVI